ncbi:MAG: Archaeal PaREP1/PaREP8 family protein [Candidatus Bathyarchaeota archaeon BA1]|nr:MAG: Archaeal PaREP1/PaREP8 family protein [Candidatus Bathyarchaeota archaeon BA1]
MQSHEQIIREAEEIFSKAMEEYCEATKERDRIKLRDACEKGWLTAVKLIDALLVSRGYKPAESHAERRSKLWEIQEKDEKIKKLGFYDRLGARSYWLHVQGFYEGSLDENAVIIELTKVKEFVEDVKLMLI